MIDDVIRQILKETSERMPPNEREILVAFEDDVLSLAKLGYGKGEEAARAAMRKGKKGVREAFGRTSQDYMTTAKLEAKAGFESTLQVAQLLGKGQQFAKLQHRLIALIGVTYCIGAVDAFKAGRRLDLAQLAYEAAAAIGQRVTATGANYTAQA